MFDDLIRNLENMVDLDGTTHDSKSSKVKWGKTVTPYKTRQEAIAAHNADSIKKHKPLFRSQGESEKEIEDKAAEKYVDDLIERMLDG